MAKTPKKKHRTPESVNDPRKGYTLRYEYDHEELGGRCRVCGTSIRYEQMLEHELTGFRIGVGRSCAKPLLEPYSDLEYNRPKNIESVRRRLVDNELEFLDYKKDLLKCELYVPRAKILVIMNHRGQYEVKLHTKSGRLLFDATNNDTTSLGRMRKDVYMAYRKFTSKTL